MGYLGDEHQKREKSFSARHGVQKSPSAQAKMMKEQSAMKSYMSQWEKEKAFRKSMSAVERKKELEMLKNYYPFGKPGGGAPLKTKSGRDLPKIPADFEIRFREGDWKMVDSRRYKAVDDAKNEYK